MFVYNGKKPAQNTVSWPEYWYWVRDNSLKIIFKHILYNVYKHTQTYKFDDMRTVSEKRWGTNFIYEIIQSFIWILFCIFVL